MINRDDMLELTRRMNIARNCFTRVAGAYMDSEGFEDGTFNIHFGKLSKPDMKKNIELAKVIPFAKTNEQLKEYKMPKGNIRNLLLSLKKNGLKDDALLSVFYELVGENYKSSKDYSIFMFAGGYDIPVKASDGERLEGSEEFYDFLICAISPLQGEYEPGIPEFGFIYPAFKDRTGDNDYINIYELHSGIQQELISIISGRKD